MQRLRNTTAVVGLATSMALTWILTEGASLASATTRYRSGAVRTQLASHLSQGVGAPAPGGLVSTGATVMAGIVALLAVAALAFMVVTFIRRRVVSTA